MKKSELQQIIKEEIKNLNLIKNKEVLNESEEPLLFSLATKDNEYETPNGFLLKFEYKEFKKDWCRLKYRVYKPEFETGGYLVDVILKGDLDNLLYQLENITLFNKRNFDGIEVIQRKINNKVPTKYRYK